MLDPSPTPPPARARASTSITDTSGAPPPSSVHPNSFKKRRVTISGAPRPGALNTDVKTAPDQTNSTPISPVVIGFTVQRDNPSAVEQVRSMLTVKQKQKALIEQRRGSVAGVVVPLVEERSAATTKTTASARPVRRSPNAGTSSRRVANATSNQATRLTSPSPMNVPSQPPVVNQVNASNQQALPPPPISFARRQLGSGKRKPADILISPREEQTQEQFAPSIQSAPPAPHAGQGGLYSGRFQMALPRLPSVIGAGEGIRRVMGGTVPPTPTRLAGLRNPPSHPITGISGRSPPNASIAISSVHVPPTPSSLQHPGYTGDKSAFLAPFGIFYDALNDSKQLKNWLGEQLQRSNALIQSLTQQQDKINELVDGLVERKVAGMRHEMSGLHRRIEELEDVIRGGSGRRLSIDASGKGKGKQALRNGFNSGPMAADSYTFPPVPMDRLRPDLDRHERRYPSPGWGLDREREPRESSSTSEQDTELQFDARRLSVSASRLDPLRSSQRQASEGPTPLRGSLNINSPPITFRDSPHGLQVPGKSLRGTPLASHRSPRISGVTPDRDHEMNDPPPPIKRDERRNSVVMSPPEEDRAS